MSTVKWQDVAIILATTALLIFTVYCIVTFPAIAEGGITESERFKIKCYGRALIGFWILIIPILGGFILKKLGYVKISKQDNLHSTTQTKNTPYQETHSKIIQDPVITKQSPEPKQTSSTTNPLPMDGSTDKIRYCSACGYKLDDDAKFCRSCGRKIE